MWIARDKDGSLRVFTVKPELLDNRVWVRREGIPDSKEMRINRNFHLEVTFENSPKKLIVE